MKFVKVKFEFEVPVMLKDNEDDVDAYYAARDKFPQYNVNDANIKIVPSNEQEYHDLALKTEYATGMNTYGE